MRKYNWHKEADVPAIRRERIKVKTMRKYAGGIIEKNTGLELVLSDVNYNQACWHIETAVSANMDRRIVKVRHFGNEIKNPVTAWTEVMLDNDCSYYINEYKGIVLFGDSGKIGNEVTA